MLYCFANSQILWKLFLIQVPSSLMTLACVKLTKNYPAQYANTCFPLVAYIFYIHLIYHLLLIIILLQLLSYYICAYAHVQVMAHVKA